MVAAIGSVSGVLERFLESIRPSLPDSLTSSGAQDDFAKLGRNLEAAISNKIETAVGTRREKVRQALEELATEKPNLVPNLADQALFKIPEDVVTYVAGLEFSDVRLFWDIPRPALGTPVENLKEICDDPQTVLLAQTASENFSAACQKAKSEPDRMSNLKTGLIALYTIRKDLQSIYDRYCLQNVRTVTNTLPFYAPFVKYAIEFMENIDRDFGTRTIGQKIASSLLATDQN